MVGHHQGVAPHSDQALSIVLPMNAFNNEFARPAVAHFSHAAPVKARVVSFTHRRCQSFCRGRELVQVFKVDQFGQTVDQHVPCPAGSTGKVQHIAWRVAKRNRKMVAHVPLALAAHRQVQCDDQGLKVCSQSAV